MNHFRTKSRRLLTIVVMLSNLLMVLAGTRVSQAQQRPNPTPTPPSAPAGPQVDQQLVTQLRQAGSGAVEIGYHRETGKVRFVGAMASGQSIRQPAALGPGQAPEAAARGFLAAYGPIFGLQDPARDTRVMRQAVRDRGRSMVRFQQVHQGIPVFGGELIVNLDAGRNVLSASGEILPDPPASVSPRVDRARAQTEALTMIARRKGLQIGGLRASDPELWIYNPVLTGGPGLRQSALVWRLEITRLDRGPLRELVLVDAARGAVVLHFSQVHTAKKRLTHTANQTPALPGTLVCDESNPTCSGGDAHALGAHQYAGEIHDLYARRFGRDSYDGAGAALVSTVHYSEFTGVPYDNAFWDGTRGQMVYGDAAAYPLADDVVGHELTHAVTEKESGLFYHYQSGAINESLSDIFGEALDLTNTSGTDTEATRWLLAEDIEPGGTGAIRNMKDPPAKGDPDRMQSPFYTADTSEQDEGGVHGNSGVSNKAAYLLVDGGAFNGKTVSAIGMDKTLWIYYEANRNLLTSASDYLDLYNALQAACFNLFGVAGITPEDCAQVKHATEAVEMHLPPLTANAPPAEAPICPAGQVPTNLFFDDLENPGTGNWSSATILVSNVWTYPPLQEFRFATSGVNNLDGFNTSSSSDSVMRMNNSVTLPAGTSYLHFNRAFDFDDVPPITYDGGVVELSTDGGLSWVDVTTTMAFTHGGYNGTIANGFGNPLAGRPAFVAESRGYGSSRLDLTPVAGQNVRFRFRIGTDGAVSDLGWFIDDVRVYQCAAGGGITVSPTSGLTTTEGGVAAQFSVALNSLPANPVTIPLSSSDPSEGTVTPNALNFTTTNGTTPQTVTVTGVADVLTDGHIPYAIVTGAALSSDPTYSGLDAADVTVTNVDACTPRQPPSVSVTPNGLGGLSVTTIAGQSTIGELRFHGAASSQVPSPNVLVDIGTLVGQSGEFTVPVGGASATFTVRRAGASGSATLPFEIVDGCGPWPTFVGGGSNAWGSGGGPMPPPAAAASSQAPAGPIAPSPVSATPGSACANFSSHAAAQAQLRANPTDPLNIDRSRNGIACEGADGAGFMNPPFDHTPVPRP